MSYAIYIYSIYYPMIPRLGHGLMANKRHTSRRAESLSFARAHLFCGFHQLLLPCNKRLTHLQALGPLMTDWLVMSIPKNIGRGSFSHTISTFQRWKWLKTTHSEPRTSWWYLYCSWKNWLCPNWVPTIHWWWFHRFTPKIHPSGHLESRKMISVERVLRPAWDSSAKRSFSFWSASRSFWIACSALDLDFLIATTWFCRSSWRNGTSGTRRNPRTWQFSQ